MPLLVSVNVLSVVVFFFLFSSAFVCSDSIRNVASIHTYTEERIAYNRAFILSVLHGTSVFVCKIGYLIDRYNRLRFKLKMMHAFCIDVQFKIYERIFASIR